ncbi:hypothetical protein [Stenotrophomonas terrae]|uniref:hypothetical protein n=1 Tax=Stenotrophomonas terrae TaxID=405446 RepID=UPI000B283645|nr:hypothetical protein [Stenotrophomonas terrae]
MKSLLSLLLLASTALASGIALADDKTACTWPLTMPAPSLLLVGEVHGTNEAPALIGDLACASAKSGNAVVVALEVPIEEQARLDHFLTSDGADADQAALLSGRFWTRQPQDGRSSAAMLKLLHRLRTLHAEGAGISLLAVDDGMAGSRDAGMAMRIRAAHNGGTPVIALLGNVHASRKKGRQGMPDYEPAGYLLSDRNPHSVYVRGPAGTAWVCVPECGVTPIPNNRFVGDKKGYLPAYEVMPGYDGLYGASSTTASLPAIN